MNKTTYNTYARVTVLLLFLSLACSGAMAQVAGNKYNGTYYENVAHKPNGAKYYQSGIRDKLTDAQKLNDTFNDEDRFVTLEHGTQIQSANTYVDTIYVHKGSSVTLILPYRSYANDVSVFDYHRWFNYRTDGSFNVNLNRNGSIIEDLLTPDQNKTSAVIYRYNNGYVTNNTVGEFTNLKNSTFSEMAFYYPTDDEFKTISDSNSSFNNGDNKYYVVGVDVSIYTDFADEYVFGGTPWDLDNPHEPTLSGRTLFYIVGVGNIADEVEANANNRPEYFEHHWCLSDSTSYQGGGNDEGTKYLEEYEIVFPSRRTSNYTPELVALSKDAQAYAIPGLSTTDDNIETPLKISFADGEANGLKLVSEELSGGNRVIEFYKDGTSLETDKTHEYGNDDTTPMRVNAPWAVENNSTATILVTKEIGETTYNIARYKLTFKEEATPLTQTQVNGLPSYTETDTYWWKDMLNRSPEYLETNYKLLTSLNFTFDTNASDVFENGNDAFYPFPLDWKSAGHVFYDGSYGTNLNGSSSNFEDNTYDVFANADPLKKK